MLEHVDFLKPQEGIFGVELPCGWQESRVKCSNNIKGHIKEFQFLQIIVD